MGTKYATVVNRCSRCNHASEYHQRFSLGELLEADSAVKAMVEFGTRHLRCPRCGGYNNMHANFT